MSSSIEILTGPVSPRDTMIRIAHDPTFPFFQIRLVRGESKEITELVFPVSPEIYDRLTEQYGSDELTFYYNLETAKSEAFSRSMIFTFNMLQKLDVMSSIQSWINTSHKFMINYLKGKKEELKISDEMADIRLNITRDILNYAGLLKRIDDQKDLFSIARDVNKALMKDPESIIYRLAMVVFHAARLTGRPVVPEIEDPGFITLSLMDNQEFAKKYPEVYKAIDEIPSTERTIYIRTFVSFVVGAYVYYSAVYEQ